MTVDELRVFHLRECDSDSYGNALHIHRERFTQKDLSLILEKSSVLISKQFQDCDFIYPMSQSRVKDLFVKGIKILIDNQGINIGLSFYSANFILLKPQKQNKQRFVGEAQAHNSDTKSGEERKVESKPKHFGADSLHASPLASSSAAVDSERGPETLYEVMAIRAELAKKVLQMSDVSDAARFSVLSSLFGVSSQHQSEVNDQGTFFSAARSLRVQQAAQGPLVESTGLGVNSSSAQNSPGIKIFQSKN